MQLAETGEGRFYIDEGKEVEGGLYGGGGNLLGREKKARKSIQKTVHMESQLDKRVQKLVKLIFDMKNIRYTLSRINYDFTKFPLGQLSRKSLLKGYAILKEVEEALKG